MKAKNYIIAAILCHLLLANSQASETSKGLLIELDIFSGRPNPVFTITNLEEIEEVIGLVKGLIQSNTEPQKTPPPRPQLGYRGFIVENASSTNSNIESFSVYRTNVTSIVSGEQKQAQEAIHVDRSYLLEKKLIAILKSRNIVSADILKQIEH